MARFVSALALAAGAGLSSAQAAPYAYVPTGTGGITGNAVAVIDLQSETVVANIPFTAPVDTVGAIPGRRFAYAINGNRIFAIDTVAQAVVFTEAPPPGDVSGVAVAMDARLPRGYAVYVDHSFMQARTRVAEMGTDLAARLGDFELRDLPVSDPVRAATFSADGSRAYFGATRSQVVVVDTAVPASQSTIRFSGSATISGLAVPPTGNRLFGTLTDPGASVGRVEVIDLATNVVTGTIAVGASPAGLVFDPQGLRLYVANRGSDNVMVIDAVTHQTLATVAVGSGPTAIDISPTGDKVYVVNALAGTVSIIATATNTVTKTVAVGPTSGSQSTSRFIGGLPLFDQPSPLTGLWWNPAQSGWGLHLTHRNSVVFVAWFTYDAAGNAKWYVASACRFPPGTDTVRIANASCDGDLFETTGPRFFRDPFDPALVKPVFAGSVRLDFRDRDNGTLNYTVGGRSASVPIARQVFRNSGLVPTTNYTDLWWNARESGWGLGITQQFGVMFLAWFVYDDAGKPVWYVAPNCALSGSGNGCSGALYRTSGPAGPASGAPFDPAAVKVTEVGTMSVVFSDASNGVLSYTVDGRSALKTITRQTF